MARRLNADEQRSRRDGHRDERQHEAAPRRTAVDRHVECSPVFGPQACIDSFVAIAPHVLNDG